MSHIYPFTGLPCYEDPIEDDYSPETAVCIHCGDTAYQDDDGSYTCGECGANFEAEDLEGD